GSAGLQLTAALAAHSLGQWTEHELVTWIREALATLATPEHGTSTDGVRPARSLPAEGIAPERYVAPTDAVALAQYAAALTAVRQALPALAAEATQRLRAIDWGQVRVDSTDLGSGGRLAVFFQVASGTRPPAAWTALARTPEELGPVF